MSHSEWFILPGRLVVITWLLGWIHKHLVLIPGCFKVRLHEISAEGQTVERVSHSEWFILPGRLVVIKCNKVVLLGWIHKSLVLKLLLPKFSHEAATRRRAYLELALSSVYS